MGLMGSLAEGRWGRVVPITFALVALLATSASAEVASSASYVLKQATVNSGGEQTTSTSYVLDASAGQESVIGCSASVSHVLQSGFWSFAGTGLQPVILMVTRNTGDPDWPDLQWTGNQDPFTVYRNIDCSAVYDTAHTTTSANTYTDDDPPAVELVCYGILSTAPGPLK